MTKVMVPDDRCPMKAVGMRAKVAIQPAEGRIMVELSGCGAPQGVDRAVSLEAQRAIEEAGRRRKRSSFTQLWALAAGLLLLNGSIVYGAVQNMQWRDAVQALPEIVPITGLSASRSMITGILDSESLTASYYWTFVVHNSTDRSQEAQLKLQLPQNATVSRATLWVNGIPEEAAFNSTERVQRAYNWITRMHRDPLLVTQTGAGTISVKAAPVMPHQDMQFRLGITASGFLRNGKVEFSMPRVVAANMDVSCPQNVHMEANDLTVSTSRNLETLISGPLAVSEGEKTVRPKQTLTRGTIGMLDLKGLRFTVERPSAGSSFATRATHSNTGSYILANVVPLNSYMSQVVCMKSNKLPSYTKLLKSEDQAFRLSTLWAFGQVEHLAEQHNETLAGQLATAYRVVSCVSGATVLENENDYRHEDLTRDPYQVLSFMPDSYVVPAASTNVVYPQFTDVAYQPAPSEGYALNSVEPYNGWISAIGFSVHSALQSTLSQSFSTVVGQLNSLNSYSASGSYGFASYVAPASYVSPSSSTNVATTAGGQNTNTTNNTSLQRLMEQMQAQNKLLHDAIYSAGTVSGGIGCGLSSQLLKRGLGTSLSPSLFGSQDKLTESLITLNVIALLIVLNFSGSFALAARAYRQSAAGEVVEAHGTATKAIGWFILALFIPDLSIFLSLWSIAGRLLTGHQQGQLQERTA
jgi:hypothetical protein